MAWSSVSISTAEAAALAKDKPLLLTPNRWLATHTAQWRTAASWVSGSDISDATRPTSRARDDFTHLVSGPSSAQVSQNLLFDFGANGIEFDTVAILNHSLPSASSAIGCSISNNSDYSSATLLFLENSVAGRRYVRHLASRYSGVRYVRILLTTGSSFQPTVGEVIFAKRVQLDWVPSVPYDNRELLSPSVRRTTTVTGITNVVSLGNHGARRLNATLEVDSPTVQDNLYAWWLEQRGTRPFLWSDNPLTAPHRACLMHQREAAFFNPWTEALNREFRLEADEQGPHYAALEP